MHDLVIRGGTVVDGSGAAPVTADVAVDGSTIVDVGRVDGSARREIDGDGLLVTPGFVDIHTHYDGQVTWDAVVAPTSLHGVTSIAMGNCGVGFAPARPDRHDWLIGLLEGVEDIPGTALAEGLTWGWESFPEYLDAVEAVPHTVDMGAHVPHAALRTYVMGDRGADHHEAPSEGELAEMARLTAEALDAGAVGFATSRTEVHRTRDGVNIGTLTASEHELTTIVGALRATGRGVVQLISDAYQSSDEELVERELELIRALAETSGRPLSFTLQQSDTAPERWRRLMQGADDMTAGGLTVRGQVSPRPIGVLLGLDATVSPFLGSATYRELRELPLAERVAALRRPEVHERVVDEATRAPLGFGYERLFRMSDPVDYEPAADSSIGAEADRLGVDAVAHALDVLLEEDGRRLLYAPFINYSYGNLDHVREMLVAPNALYGLSDGGAHCGTICDASYPTTTLTLWARDRSRGELVPIEHLVRGYTRRNAEHVGWMDRGLVAPGYLADLNVIDFDVLDTPPPFMVQDLPAGGKRLMQPARGYRYTVKSGQVTFEDGAHTGALPGSLLRGGRQASPISA